MSLTSIVAYRPPDILSNFSNAHNAPTLGSDLPKLATLETYLLALRTLTIILKDSSSPINKGMKADLEPLLLLDFTAGFAMLKGATGPVPSSQR